jgi:hypothetical protein
VLDVEVVAGEGSEAEDKQGADVDMGRLTNGVPVRIMGAAITVGNGTGGGAVGGTGEIGAVTVRDEDDTGTSAVGDGA